MYYKFLLSVLVVFAIINKSRVEAGSCGLEGIPQTSPDDLFLLPALPDHLEGNGRAWEIAYTGSVVGLTTTPIAHWTYLNASFSTRSRTYWFFATSKSKSFVKDFYPSREMIRYGTLKCGDLSTTTYHFKIPFQDMQTPTFSENEYTFNISADWEKDRPISDGQFVTISDNAIELERNPKFLRYSVWPDDIIHVVEHPLWVLPYPTKYYFRLDIYLKDGVSLEAGRTFQINLSASDGFNSGTTKITIHVSD